MGTMIECQQGVIPLDVVSTGCGMGEDPREGAIQCTVKVLLSGRLRLDGFGRRYRKNVDDTVDVSVPCGGTVLDVEREMGVPAERVAMTMVNGHGTTSDQTLQPGDRVVLIPPDVASLWRFLGTQNLGMRNPLSL